MRRDPHLHGMTSDHHHALVLADRLRQASARGAVTPELVVATCRTFDAELDPHFVLEEALILPALTAGGESGLVERTHAEHRQLRASIREIANAADPAPLIGAFADLLTAHVRFEEAELFDAAQAILTTAELEQIARARPHSRSSRHHHAATAKSGTNTEGKR